MNAGPGVAAARPCRRDAGATTATRHMTKLHRMDERETTESDPQPPAPGSRPPAPSLQPPSSEPDVELGKVVGVFGLKGEVKLEPYADFPERYSALKEVTAAYPDGRRRPLRAVGARKHKVHILMRFEGVDDPETAEALRGAVLVIPFSQRAELPKDHYYVSDLLGMDIVTTAGEAIGPITDVWRTPAGDVYVTERGTVPAVKQYVKDVDLQRRRVVVTPVPGMFDDENETEE